MKIAILTQPLKANYGGMLQAYALQQVLKDLGHEPTTIDRRFMKKPWWRSALSWVKFHVLRTLRNSQTIREGRKQEATVFEHTLRFIRSHIQLSEPIHDTPGMNQHFERHAYDAVVVGSDQTWRLDYSPQIENFYLDFLDGKSIKRLAYAASFGADEWRYDPALTQRCGALLKNFDATSVREHSAIALCKENFGVDAQVVLDPTMLLTASEYVRRLDLPPLETEPNDLFTYVLDDNEFRRGVIRQVSEAYGLRPFTCQPSVSLHRGGSRKTSDYVFPPVESWVAAFHRAAFVVTDSFHGCVFAILFNKPFVAVGNAHRGMARFHTLLQTFELEGRLVTADAGLSAGVLYETIDWTRVNQLLFEHRSVSLDFLRRNLHSKDTGK